MFFLFFFPGGGGAGLIDKFGIYFLGIDDIMTVPEGLRDLFCSCRVLQSYLQVGFEVMLVSSCMFK